jgi:hypothetical protein
VASFAEDAEGAIRAKLIAAAIVRKLLKVATSAARKGTTAIINRPYS